MAQQNQINVNEIVPPMLNMAVQIMPLKMIMGVMSAAMGGGMMGKTEKKEQYWWVVEYNTTLYNAENEPKQSNVIIHGPKDNAVDAMKLVKKLNHEHIAYHTFSTKSSSRVDTFNTFLDWLKGKRINTTNVRQEAIMPDVSTLANKAKRAITAADDAFWAEIAKAFPEVRHGDLSPEDTLEFENAEIDVVTSWLRWNHPKLENINTAGIHATLSQQIRKMM